MARQPLDVEPLLTAGEVAALLGVDRRTVTRWADLGLLDSIRTLGGGKGLGHRRYREAQVRALLQQRAQDGAA